MVGRPLTWWGQGRFWILGVASGAILALGLFWVAVIMSSQPAMAMGMIQVPSAKSAVSAEEILSRFPKAQHEEYMRRAIANARKAGVEYKTGGAFGAVIVDRDGVVLADGMNHVVAQNDPTWHGEMHAIRQACALLKKPKLDGCILYTSSEPCPMCLATSYWAGLDGIIYGASVEDAKTYGNFDDAFIYAQFARPATERAIPQVGLLRVESVAVWKEYQARNDKVDY